MNSLNAGNNTDQFLAISVLMNTLQTNLQNQANTQNSTNLSSSSKIAITNTSYNVPNLTKNHSSSHLHQKPSKAFASPKKRLYALVLKYNASVEEMKSLEKNDSKFESMKVQNDALRSEICAILKTDYKAHMINSQHGFIFFQNKNDIPLNCFVSAEAVWWCIENVDEVDNEADAIILMQVMCDFDLCRHISNQQKVTSSNRKFIHFSIEAFFSSF